MFAADKAGKAAQADPYFYDVSLLLTGDGTNGAQNNTFLDSSTNNFTITRNGNTTQGSFSPYGSLWSNYFGTASTDYLSLTGTALGTGDFTVECWINLSSVASTAAIFSFGTSDTANNGEIYIYSSDRHFVWYQGGERITSGANVIPLATWTHIAVCRSSGTTRMFMNGAQVGSNYTDGTNYTSTAIRVGYGYGVSGMVGYMSNFRQTNTALYTSNFTPSTTPLTAVSGTSLLTCQSNRFIDNSSNNFALTVSGTPSVQRFSPFNPTASYTTATIGGSGYFDGSGDYLSVADNAALTLNADFTMEFWFYQNVSGTQGFLQHRNGASWGTGDFQIQDNGTTVLFQTPSASLATGTYQKNAWNHYALVRSGTTITAYLNGVSQGTMSSSVSYTGNGGDV